jgi:putative peptide zinc metalloprotease protein
MSANLQPLRLSPRSDVTWATHWLRGQQLILVTDPVREEHGYWRPEEWFLWQQLQPQTTRTALQQAWQQQFAPRQISLQSIQEILQRLWQAGLVQGSGTDIANDSARNVNNMMVWQGPGFRPNTLCDWLRPVANGLASSLAQGALLLFLLSAVVLALLQRESLAFALSTLTTQLGNWHWLNWILVGAGVKLWHELGHLLAATAWNVPVQRLGITFWLGIPTMTCKINGAWQAERRARLWINGAGILAELCLAALALWCWANSSPSWWHDLCLQIAVWGTLNTLLLNGNPLVRWDGYYFWSDWFELPNLAQQAQQTWRTTWRTWIGLAQPPTNQWQTHSRGMQWSLLLYAIASPIYRWCLVLGLLTFVASYLQPLGLVTPTRLLGLLFLIVLMLPLIKGASQLQRLWSVQSESDRQRVFYRIGWLALLSTIVLFVPWPNSQRLPVLWQAPHAMQITATIPGQLHSVANIRQVTTGQTLVTLANPELARKYLAATGAVAEQKLRVEQLRRRLNDPAAAGELTAAEARLLDLEQQVTELAQQQVQLTITAPRTGTWLPPRTKQQPSQMLDEQGLSAITPVQFTSWQGSPFAAENQLAWIETGTDLGWIVPADERQAWALVPQTDVAELAIGQPVELSCEAWPGRHWSGTITELAMIPSAQLPWEWREILGTDAATSPDAKTLNTRTTWYSVKIACTSETTQPIWGTTGHATISLSNKSLAQSGYAWWCRQFYGTAW